MVSNKRRIRDATRTRATEGDIWALNKRLIGHSRDSKRLSTASSIWVRKETSSVVKDMEEMNESLALERKKKKGDCVCQGATSGSL